MLCVFRMIRRIPYTGVFQVSSLTVQLSVYVRVAFSVDTVVKYSWAAVKQCGFLLA